MKKSHGHLQQDTEMIFKFIKENRSSFPVKKMCHVFNVSPSGYYRWIKAPISTRQIEKDHLKKRIQELFEQHNGMVGSPIITADLHDQPEFSNVSRQRVARMMKEMGLKCRTVKKFVVTTDSKHTEPVAPNLLDRKFTVSSPDLVWVTDITYLKIGSKWHYLTVFIDLFSRIVVGWDLSDSLERHSAIRALNKAILRRHPGQGLMVHSDRGVQYASSDFRALLQKRGFVQSMSRKGNCWDNAVAESFFHTIKTQMIHHCTFHNVAEAEQTIFHYIEVYYNRQRKHSTNGYKAPAQYELEWWDDRKAA
ncbi:IS3 family transposase [Desulfomarina profundi]